MKNCSFMLAFVAFAISLTAQEAYHTGIQSQLQTDYALPNGQWVLPNTESATLTGATQYAQYKIEYDERYVWD